MTEHLLAYHLVILPWSLCALEYSKFFKIPHTQPNFFYNLTLLGQGHHVASCDVLRYDNIIEYKLVCTLTKIKKKNRKYSERHQVKVIFVVNLILPAVSILLFFFVEIPWLKWISHVSNEYEKKNEIRRNFRWQAFGSLFQLSE